MAPFFLWYNSVFLVDFFTSIDKYCFKFSPLKNHYI